MSPVSCPPAELLAQLDETRARTLDLVGRLPDEVLEDQHSPLMSPLVWDLGHIAAFEDLWLVHHHGRRRMLRQGLARTYDAFETPRSVRGVVPLLDTAGALDYLDEVREHARGVVAERGPGDGRLLDLVLRHEQQHVETMLQTLELAHVPPAFLPEPESAPAGPPAGDLEWVDIPGGLAEVGAGSTGFAYDNERPRHRVALAPYRLTRSPITNATFLRFVEGGGYERREWWTAEGWAWKEDYDITHPAEWTDDGREWRAGEGLVPLDPHRPVVHVSWFEADAFARAHAARLPSEAEWEHAARGSDPAAANLDQRCLGTGVPGAPSECGAVGMLGDVWEWTSSDFRGYPGFAPDPYRQYSEPFFGEVFKVLRGGSWATRRRVATTTFRNWDFPQRRQIFSGFRLARTA